MDKIFSPTKEETDNIAMVDFFDIQWGVSRAGKILFVFSLCAVLNSLQVFFLVDSLLSSLAIFGMKLP